MAEQGKGLQLLCCPFGARSSVYSWHRLGSFLQALLARELYIAYPRFVDDLFSADQAGPNSGNLTGPEGTAHCAEQLLCLTGWELKPAKRVRNVTSATMLGVETAAAPGELIFTIGPQKRDKWLDEISKALEADFLRPSDAKRLAGRLNWAGSAVFGKGARAYLAALHWQANRCTGKLTARVRTALGWWQRFLRSAPERRVPLAPAQAQRCLVYTDAAGDGHLAFALVHPSLRAWGAATVPKAAWAWAHPRRTQIVLWELVAAVCAVQCLLEHGLADCELILFVDCNPALQALVRGASRQSDLNDIITGFWFQVARAAVLLHAFRAPSKLNIADGPTRRDSWAEAVEEFHRRGFNRLQWLWPPGLPWLQE